MINQLVHYLVIMGDNEKRLQYKTETNYFFVSTKIRTNRKKRIFA